MLVVQFVRYLLCAFDGVGVVLGFFLDVMRALAVAGIGWVDSLDSLAGADAVLSSFALDHF